MFKYIHEFQKLSTYNSLCENASLSNNYNLYNVEISHDLGICASSTMHYKLFQKTRKLQKLQWCLYEFIQQSTIDLMVIEKQPFLFVDQYGCCVVIHSLSLLRSLSNNHKTQSTDLLPFIICLLNIPWDNVLHLC